MNVIVLFTLVLCSLQGSLNTMHECKEEIFLMSDVKWFSGIYRLEQIAKGVYAA